MKQELFLFTIPTSDIRSIKDEILMRNSTIGNVIEV